jgi:putative FmdB family regulatory protein
MPIYEYICSACDHRADIFHGINDPGPNFCPSCGQEGTMRKAIVAAAIHYKGSGWAKKDRSSSSKGSKKDAKAEDATPPKSSDGATPDPGSSAGAEAKSSSAKSDD